jgi:protein SCO1/2
MNLNNTIKNPLFLIFIALILCAVSMFIFLNSRSKYELFDFKNHKPVIFQNTEIIDKIGSFIPLHLNFTNHLGKNTSLLSNLNNKPFILTLGYYKCPMLCGLVFKGLLEMLKNLQLDIGKNFNIISISIDPKENHILASTKRKNILTSISMNENNEIWPFLVGEENNISKVAESVGFCYKYDNKSNQFIHSAGIFVLTSMGKLSKVFYGIKFNEQDVKFSLMDASNGKTGSIVDRIILSCFHYDPDSHRYGFYIFGFIRIVSIIILIGLLLLIVVLRCKENTSGGK